MIRKSCMQLPRHAARDLRDLQGVREARTIEITFAEVQDLGLALKPSERTRVYNTRIVDIKRLARIALMLCPSTAALNPDVSHEQSLAPKL